MVRHAFVCLALIGCTATPSPDPAADPGPADPDPADRPPDDEVVGDTSGQEPECTTSAACDDGNPCDGVEVCTPEGTCAEGEPVVCDGPDETCVVDLGEPVCEVLCAVPRAPTLTVVDDDEVLSFDHPATEVALLQPGVDPAPGDWEASATVSLAGLDGPVRIVARVPAEDCADAWFDHTYDVRPHYPGAAGEPSSQAVPLDDPAITGWAAAATEAIPGDALDPSWSDTSQALGPAEGTSTGIVALGRGGWLTVQLDGTLADGPGPDLAVFENGFSDAFLELAYVEVSSDGDTFVRFASAARTPDPLGAFDLSDPTTLHGLAGVYRQGFATPFDLATLRWEEAVRTGVVDLSAITHVRLVDVVGDGSDLDSFGRPIHDPFPTTGSAGFDLDAVATLQPLAIP